MKVDLRSEPVRLIGVPIVVAIVGVLVARGFIDSDVGDIVLALVFGVTGATGLTAMRARVTPVGKALNAETAAIATTLETAQQVLEAHGLPAGDLVDRIASDMKATPPTGL